MRSVVREPVSPSPGAGAARHLKLERAGTPMLIVMRPNATAQDIERVNDEIRRRGWQPHAIPGGTRTAVGTDGIIVEVHPDPPRARSDGHQSLDFPEFEKSMAEVRAIVHAMGREMVRLG